MKVAERVIRQLVDDIDGTDISDGGQTVEFSFRGTDYRLDLSEENLSKFERAIRPFVDAAEKALNPDNSSAARASRAGAAQAGPKRASDARGRPRRSSTKTPSTSKRSRKPRQTKKSTPTSKEKLAQVSAAPPLARAEAATKGGRDLR